MNVLDYIGQIDLWTTSVHAIPSPNLDAEYVAFTSYFNGLRPMKVSATPRLAYGSQKILLVTG